MGRRAPVFLLAVACLTPGPAKAQTPPNIIVFLVDDMGWRDWTMNGAPDGSGFYETPNMDRLAAEGVRFTQAYSASSVCSPSRIALLTGKHPARTRMTQWIPGSEYSSNLRDPVWQDHLDPAETTIAEALQLAGYAAHFVGKWHLGARGTASSSPRNHGFQTNYGGGYQGGAASYFADADGSFGLPNLGPGTSPPGAYLTDRLTDLAVDLVDAEILAGRPFFLLLSHYAVHVPLQAPLGLVAKYQAKEPAGGHGNAIYAAMLERVDTSLGRLLDLLEARGVRDDTIIVFASDNGGAVSATSNLPLREGKGILYEGGIRTPLIVSWTGNDRIAQGSVEDALVVTQDLYPTLLDLADLPGDPIHNAWLDGVSLRPALEGEAPTRRAAYWHYPHISPQSVDRIGGRYVCAIRSEHWKLLYHFETDSWELYDLARDPGELIDLADERRDVASALGNQLVDWMVETDAQLPTTGFFRVAIPMPEPLPEPGVALLTASSLLTLGALARRARARSRRSG